MTGFQTCALPILQVEAPLPRPCGDLEAVFAGECDGGGDIFTGFGAQLAGAAGTYEGLGVGKQGGAPPTPLRAWVHKREDEVAPRFELARVVKDVDGPDRPAIVVNGNPSELLEAGVIPVAVVDTHRLLVVTGLWVGGGEDHVFVRGLPPRFASIVFANGVIEYVETASGARTPLKNGSRLEIGKLNLVIHAAK